MKKNLLSFILLFNTILLFGQVNEITESNKLRTHKTQQVNQTLNPLMNNYDVVYYGLNIEASTASITITSGKTTIKAKVVNNPLHEFVIQLIDQLTVSQVKLNGSSVTFAHQNNEISFTCPTDIPVGDLFIVEVFYSGNPQGGGWDRTIASTWNIPVTWTLSESFHAYEWFAVKQSLTDKADSSDVYVTVPSNLEVASNGLLKNVVDVGGGKKRYEWQSRYPIDYYLISVTISDYIEYDTYANPVGMSSPLLIQNFVYNVTNCLNQYKSAIDGTAANIELYSNLFGLYPFSKEKYGHVMAPFGGGMEHQTITTLGYYTSNLISHELAHMWFGDYVTCATWQDIWINEGFASYAEYLYLQNLSSQTSADSWMVSAHNYALQEPNGSVFIPLANATDENRIFSYSLSYKKGASIIHILRHEINNDDVFFSILKGYLQKFGHSTATGEDFKTVVNDSTGFDYSWFFDQWYYGYGFPTISAKYGYIDDKPWVTIIQTPSNASTPLFKFSLDLKLTYYDNTTSIQRVFVSENPQTFNFDLPKIKSLQIDPQGWLLYKAGSITSSETIEDSFSWVTFGPNPVNDKLMFSVANNVQKVTVTISDITGKMIYKSDFSNNQFGIDASFLAKGVYIVSIDNGLSHISKKLVKE